MFLTKYTVFCILLFFLLGKLPWKTMCYAQRFAFVEKFFIVQKLNKGILVEFFPDVIFHTRRCDL